MFKRVTVLDVELVIVHIVQEHVHAGEIGGSVVDCLPEEPLFDEVIATMLLGLQKQGP